MDSTELSGDAAEDDGKVTLTVWAEEANFDVLQEMIDSFEQKYAGQADFDIQLAENADAETRNTLLGDVHNGADVFPLPDDPRSATHSPCSTVSETLFSTSTLWELILKDFDIFSALR